MSKFPHATLIENAAVDQGFDRKPATMGDLLLFRSTQHAHWLAVATSEEGCPLAVWVPRGGFSVRLLDVAGVDLAGPQPPVPHLNLGITVSLTVGDLPAVRGLFGRAHAVFSAPGQAPQVVAANTAALPPLAAADHLIQHLPESTIITREVIALIGQDRFRDALIAYWNGCCAVMGLSIVPLLRASHIKPWAACATASERLDVHNGLLLAPHLDAAFDGGWISFSDQGDLLIGPLMDPENAARLGIPPGGLADQGHGQARRLFALSPYPHLPGMGRAL